MLLQQRADGALHGGVDLGGRIGSARRARKNAENNDGQNPGRIHDHGQNDVLVPWSETCGATKQSRKQASRFLMQGGVGSRSTEWRCEALAAPCRLGSTTIIAHDRIR
jgi:hypothetical protein